MKQDKFYVINSALFIINVKFGQNQFITLVI